MVEFRKFTNVNEERKSTIEDQILNKLFTIGGIIKNGDLPDREKEKILHILEQVTKGNFDLVLKDSADRRETIVEGVAKLLVDEPHACIAVIGTGKNKLHVLKAIAKSYGLSDRNIEIVNGFEHSHNIPVDELRGHKWKGVLLGPVPHSIHGVGGHTSLFDFVKDSVGKPVVLMKTNSDSGEVKVTKSSFKAGLEDLLYKIITSTV